MLYTCNPPPPILPLTHDSTVYLGDLPASETYGIDPNRMQLTDVQFLVLLLFTLW